MITPQENQLFVVYTHIAGGYSAKLIIGF